jgi:hypothetical protein
MLRAHTVDPRLHKVLFEQVPRVGRLGRVHEGRKFARGISTWRRSSWSPPPRR